MIDIHPEAFEGLSSLKSLYDVVMMEMEMGMALIMSIAYYSFNILISLCCLQRYQVSFKEGVSRVDVSSLQCPVLFFSRRYHPHPIPTSIPIPIPIPIPPLPIPIPIPLASPPQHRALTASFIFRVRPYNVLQRDFHWQYVQRTFWGSQS